MTTVINNPGNSEGTDSFISIVMGVILLLVLTTVFVIYALPALRNAEVRPQESSIDVNVQLPPVKVIPAIAPPAPTPAPATN